MKKDLESIVEREVDTLGYDIVLLRQSGTRSRPVLEIRIDRRDGERVSIADCARVSRAVEARLDAGVGDAAIFGGGRYELQVSSPGDARRAQDAQGGVKQLDAGRLGVEDAGLGNSKGQGRPRGSPGGAYTDDGSRDGRFD
jgi:hypothetical protein